MGNDRREKEAKLLLAMAEKARRSFRHFIRYVAPDYIFNWHHLVLIDALQRLAERKYQRLIVMEPPRHGKSYLVSILFPAWCFARNSSEHIIVASYAVSLASRMSRDCQRVLSSDRFTQMFPTLSFSEAKEVGAIRTGHRFDMPGGGHYIAAGVGGGITGEGATIGIIDDPVKNSEEADSMTYREKAWEWYATTFSTRFETGAIEVVCQTRWHEDDLTGRILEKKKNGTEVIRFPALCEEAEAHRQIGDALWPEFYPREVLLERQAENGSRAWNALYQQRPAPDEGSTIKRRWFGYYDPREYKFENKKVDYYFDTAYTEEEKNDPTGGIAYVKEGAYFYVLEFHVDWMDFEAQIEFVKDFCKRNGYSYRSIARVEPKATGKTLASTMKKSTGLNIAEGKPPKGDKVARAHSCQGTLEGGRVLLPRGMAWVDRFLAQCAAFPNAAHDEEVDCLTGMIISELSAKPGVRFA